MYCINDGRYYWNRFDFLRNKVIMKSVTKVVLLAGLMATTAACTRIETG